MFSQPRSIFLRPNIISKMVVMKSWNFLVLQIFMPNMILLRASASYTRPYSSSAIPSLPNPSSFLFLNKPSKKLVCLDGLVRSYSPTTLLQCPLNHGSRDIRDSIDDAKNLSAPRNQIPKSDTSSIDNHDQPIYEPADDIVVQKTLSWIQNVVIQLNLCPFADKPMRSSKLFTSVVRGTDEEEIMGVILYESTLRRDDPGTTVVICPEYFPNHFEEYLHLVHVLEDALQDFGLDGHVQIAPFHPFFQFEGSGENGLDNWTNRSPYPTFHIIREEEVSVAVDKLGGDASKVWKRNISLLHEMEKVLGRDDTERVLKGEVVDGVDEILKRMRTLD